MRKGKQQWLLLLCVLLFGVFCLTACSGRGGRVVTMEAIEESKEPDKIPEVLEGGNLTLSIDYGFDKYVKSGCYMRVMADITNNGENFMGSLRVIIPDSSQKRYMYQKDVSIAAGETKRVEMAVPVGSDTISYNFVVADEEERVIAEKSVKAYISRDESLFTGILTDDTQSMSYLSGSQLKTFYLGAETFPEDVMALDSLDILIINDFNTDKLGTKQYEALKNFVTKGGTLVLGTGATGQKTLALFDDSFFKGTIGGLSRKTTAFGLNEEGLTKIKAQLLEEVLQRQAQEEAEKQEETSETQEADDEEISYELFPEAEEINRLQLSLVEKDILDVHLEGAVPVVKEDGTVLLERLDIGQGNVLLATMDLGLDSSLRDTIGMEIINQIASNISISRQDQRDMENTGYNFNYLRNSAVELIDEDKLPKVSSYVVILLVYILVIGPPLYFILKRLDKRNLMWILIPVFSVLFGSFIYGIGDTTRQSGPYIGYFALNTIENGTVDEDIFFGITAPYNNNYEVDVSEIGDLVPLVEEGYYSNSQATEGTDYNIAIKYSGDTTKIEIKDYSAFEPTYFETNHQAAATGTVGSTMKFEDFQITGEITNLLGQDLKQTALYAYGTVYLLGDIEQGQTISLDDREGYKIMNRSDIYRYDEFLTKISGGRPYGNRKEQTAEQIRYYYSYEYFLSKEAASFRQGCYLLGFSSEDSSVLETTGLEASGVTMMAVAVDVDLKGENGIYIPKIDSYIQNIEGGVDTLERVIYEENITMDIQFDSRDVITELIYSEAMNNEFDIGWSNGFYGEIRAYNYLTGNYDLIFTSGTPGSVSTENYVNEDNQMRLLIEADAARMESYQVTLPILSAIKEGK